MNKLLLEISGVLDMYLGDTDPDISGLSDAEVQEEYPVFWVAKEINGLIARGENTPSEREILLRLIGSLALCDHMGDVAGDVMDAFEKLGYSDGDFCCGDSSVCWDSMRKGGIFMGTLHCDPSKFEEDDS